MIKNSFQSIKIMYKSSNFLTIVKLFEMFITAIILPISLIFIKQLTESLSLYINGNGSLEQLVLWVSLLILSSFYLTGSGFFNGLLYVKMERKLNEYFTDRLIDKYKKIEYSQFENKDVFDTFERIGNKPQEKVLKLFLNTISILSIIISIIGLLIIFTQISIWFAPIFILMLLTVIYIEFKSMHISEVLRNSNTKEQRKLKYLNSLLNDKHSLLELRVFKATNFIRTSIKELYNSLSVNGSSEAVGSSNIIRFESDTIERDIAIRCHCPPDKSTPSCSNFPRFASNLSPTMLKTSSASPVFIAFLNASSSFIFLIDPKAIFSLNVN